MASFLLTKDNKFKVGNIITNFKEPTKYFRPVNEWIDEIDKNFATWKVIGINDKNGDYKLQKLDTLTQTPLLKDGGPIYQTATMSKGLIDNHNYRLWDKTDVDAIYDSARAKAKDEDEAHNRQFQQYKTDMAAYFEEHGNSIEKTAKYYNIENDEVLDVINNHTSKLAKKAGGRKSKKRGTKRSKKRRRKSKKRRIKRI
jgi:hypothetical protein